MTESFWLETNASLITAVLLLFVGQGLKLWIETEIERRRVIKEYLVEAYTELEASCRSRICDPNKTSYELRKHLQHALELIQLYGSVEQVDLARSVVTTIQEGTVADLTKLTTSLRDDLRKRLGLKEISEEWFWLQAVPDEENK